MCNIVYGESCDSMDDGAFQTIVAPMQDNKKMIPNDLIPIFPWLRHFPISIVRLIKKTMGKIDLFVRKRCDERCKSLDPAHPRKFLSWMIMASKDEKTLKQNGLKELTRD